jgi:NO-binding membrane sensor protein with MHYT domain
MTGSYDFRLVPVSIVIALGLTFRLREYGKSSPLWKTGSAVMMGAAIPIMHYTGIFPFDGSNAFTLFPEANQTCCPS